MKELKYISNKSYHLAGWVAIAEALLCFIIFLIIISGFVLNTDEYNTSDNIKFRLLGYSISIMSIISIYLFVKFKRYLNHILYFKKLNLIVNISIIWIFIVLHGVLSLLLTFENFDYDGFFLVIFSVSMFRGIIDIVTGFILVLNWNYITNPLRLLSLIYLVLGLLGLTLFLSIFLSFLLLAAVFITFSCIFFKTKNFTSEEKSLTFSE